MAEEEVEELLLHEVRDEVRDDVDSISNSSSSSEESLCLFISLVKKILNNQSQIYVDTPPNSIEKSERATTILHPTPFEPISTKQLNTIIFDTK